MMWAYGGFAGLGMMLLGWLAMLLFLAAAVVFAVWLFQAVSPRDARRDDGRAVEILRQRFAAGEIDEAAIQRRNHGT